MEGEMLGEDVGEWKGCLKGGALAGGGRVKF